MQGARRLDAESAQDPKPSTGLAETWHEFFRAVCFVWLVVFASELINAFPPSALGGSSTVRLQALLAGLVCLVVVLLVTLAGTVLIGSAAVVDGWRGRRSSVDTGQAGCWSTADAWSIALGLSSLLVMWRATHPGSYLQFHFAVAVVLGALVLRVWPRLRGIAGADLFVAAVLAVVWSFATLAPIGERVEAIILLGLAGAVIVVRLLSLGRVSISMPLVKGESLRSRVPMAVYLAFAVVVPALTLIADDRALESPPAEVSAPLAEQTPNVLLFVVDTLRADHTGIGGGGLVTTPALDAARARRATTFGQAWSGATSTIASMKSLFTSASPSRWGFEGAGKLAPPADAWTVPRAMQARGFRTAGFSANALLRKPGFYDGFDRFFALGGLDVLDDSYLLGELLCRNDSMAKWELADLLRIHKVAGQDVVGWSRDWMEAVGDEPFFLYVHILDPHWPYHERGYDLIPRDLPGFARRFSYLDFMQDPELVLDQDEPGLREMVGRYDEEIRLADDVFASMMDLLQEQGVAEETLVFFASDHGEAFFEHGVYGHGGNVYQEQSHVPLVVFWPEAPFGRYGEMLSEPPARVDVPVSLLDLAPTLADLFDLSRPAAGFEGRSLLPLLDGDPSGPRPVITESFTPNYCRAGYREGDWMTWIQFSRGSSPLDTEDVEVFDLARDPGQQAAIVPSDPEVRDFAQRARMALHERWLRWPDRAEVAESSPAETPEEQLVLDQLRALGYVD